MNITGQTGRRVLVALSSLAMLAGVAVAPITGAGAAEGWPAGLSQAQIHSSYGFFKWMSVYGGSEDQKSDARRAMNHMNADIKDDGYTNLGAKGDATSLENTGKALREDVRSNQFRTSLVNEPCRMDLPAGKGRRCNDPNKRLTAQKLNLQLLGSEQNKANAVAATGDHFGITDAQNIAGPDTGFRVFYDGQSYDGVPGMSEKSNYDKDMTDGKLDGRSADGKMVGETGHYRAYVNSIWNPDRNQYNDYVYATIAVNNASRGAYVMNYYMKANSGGSITQLCGWSIGDPDADDSGCVKETTGYLTDQAMTLPQNLLAKFDQYTALPEVNATVTHTVSFDSAGGSRVAGQSVKDGQKAVAPANPTRSGYTFAGWYSGSAKWDFSKPVTGNLTLTAKWTKNAPQVVYRTVSFDSAGGSQVASQRVANGQKATQPANPTRNGYSFAGWFNGSVKWDFSRPVTANLTLAAHWTKNATPVKPTDPSKPSSKKVPVYRVYNRNSGLHHYTTSKAENDMLVRLGWRDENHGKSSFITVSKDTPGARPVYREYNHRSGNHNWTLNKAEHDMLVRLGWKDEGIAWYTSPAGQDVYRLYNPKPYHKPRNGRGNGGGEHVYTTSYGEYLAVVRAGWRGEGVAWKSL
ncbi:InlB B-repeat-containing protein [Bifidobacterium simiarum]|uniref:DUF5648 domain-containing protein n=1 Tax=Bifidobacterium simiarum TaxID=2045441 RepID=A0A2M9HHQ0_9BIFI|nr:InlB B-repeat-containing protein [Bifidobacterium simiarum]PJM76313.1 hypothetical protein CSQ87_02065 [Bifidobacterium simiarum]